MPTIVPSFTIPAQNAQMANNALKQGGMPSIPLPLLILNSLQPQQTIQDKKGNSPSSTNGNSNDRIPNGTLVLTCYCNNSIFLLLDLNNVLKELLEVQKENLSVEKEKLELEKQRIEFNRVVGSQLLTLVPMIGGILQRLALNSRQDENTSNINRKRKNSEEIDILKDSKILRSVLEQGIRKYMLGEENDDNDKDSDNEDSGIQNEENSNHSESK